jgi:hypothetical protein
MTNVARIALLALWLGLTVHLGTSAFADEGDDRANWFKNLLQPGTRAPCCDISDCERTVADWHDGQWWAIVVGKWTPIPPAAVLNNTRSIDGDAYVCATHYRKIYCFVKPNLGM